jgi:hypothetical protein
MKQLIPLSLSILGMMIGAESPTHANPMKEQKKKEYKVQKEQVEKNYHLKIAKYNVLTMELLKHCASIAVHEQADATDSTEMPKYLGRKSKGRVLYEGAFMLSAQSSKDGEVYVFAVRNGRTWKAPLPYSSGKTTFVYSYQGKHFKHNIHDDTLELIDQGTLKENEDLIVYPDRLKFEEIKTPREMTILARWFEERIKSDLLGSARILQERTKDMGPVQKKEIIIPFLEQVKLQCATLDGYAEVHDDISKILEYSPGNIQLASDSNEGEANGALVMDGPGPIIPPGHPGFGPVNSNAPGAKASGGQIIPIPGAGR